MPRKTKEVNQLEKRLEFAEAETSRLRMELRRAKRETDGLVSRMSRAEYQRDVLIEALGSTQRVEPHSYSTRIAGLVGFGETSPSC